jgi:hypothetical protein
MTPTRGSHASLLGIDEGVEGLTVGDFIGKN